MAHVTLRTQFETSKTDKNPGGWQTTKFDWCIESRICSKEIYNPCNWMKLNKFSHHISSYFRHLLNPFFAPPKTPKRTKMNRTPAFSHQTQQACHPPRLLVVATVVVDRITCWIERHFSHLLPPGSLTVRPWKYTGPQKERRVFQQSFFRGELLNFGRVHLVCFFSGDFSEKNHQDT